MFGFLKKTFGQPLPVELRAVGFIGYGRTKADGSHDHRSNRGNDRTPAQRLGDLKRTGPRCAKDPGMGEVEA